MNCLKCRLYDSTNIKFVICTFIFFLIFLTFGILFVTKYQILIIGITFFILAFIQLMFSIANFSGCEIICCYNRHNTVLHSIIYDSNNNNDLEKPICSICLDNYDRVPAVAVRCGHAFHLACINEWQSIKPNCPMCRAPI